MIVIEIIREQINLKEEQVVEMLLAKEQLLVKVSMDKIPVQDLYPFVVIDQKASFTITALTLVLLVVKHLCTVECLKWVLQIRMKWLFYLWFSHSKPLDQLRLDKLQKWIDDGRIDPTHVITMKTLVDSGLMSNIKYGVKIVAHVALLLIYNT